MSLSYYGSFNRLANAHCTIFFLRCLLLWPLARTLAPHTVLVLAFADCAPANISTSNLRLYQHRHTSQLLKKKFQQKCKQSFFMTMQTLFDGSRMMFA